MQYGIGVTAEMVEEAPAAITNVHLNRAIVRCKPGDFVVANLMPVDRADPTFQSSGIWRDHLHSGLKCSRRSFGSNWRGMIPID